MAESQVGGGSTCNGEGAAGKKLSAWLRPRACVRCGQSKVKCIWPSAPGVGPCKRCARAGYRCISPETSLRRKRGPSMRVARLEEKVDQLASLVSASQNAYCSPSSSGSPSPTVIPGHVASTSAPRAGPERSYNNEPRLSFRASSTTLEQPSRLAFETLLERDPLLAQMEIIPGFQMTIEDANIAVNCYRDHYTPHFPFVPIPSSISLHVFQQEKPFLLRVIIWAVVSLSSETRRNMDEWFRRYIAEEIVVKRERRLELLQGLLLLISWGNNYFNLDCRVTDLVYLAMTLVEDLGLDKPPHFTKRGPYTSFSEAFAATAVGGPSPKQKHTLDEIRSCLGCFYICGVISDLFRRSFRFPFTSYLGRCCNMLQTAREFDSDDFLVILVRMQRLASRAVSVFSVLELDDGAPRLFNESLHMTVSTVRKELDALVGHELQKLEGNLVLSMLYHAVCARLYESAIYMQASLLASNDATGANHRTEALSNCLSSIKDAFAACIALPVEVLRITPFCISTHFSFIIRTACRLLFLEDPDWDVSVARRSLNFADICEQAARQFDNANKTDVTSAENPGSDRRQHTGLNKMLDGGKWMAVYRDKLWLLRSWYLSKVHGTGGNDGEENNNGEKAVGDPVSAMWMPMDAGSLSDATFWQALLNDNWSWDELGGDLV